MQFKDKYEDKVTKLVNRKSLTLLGDKPGVNEGDDAELVRPLAVLRPNLSS